MEKRHFALGIAILVSAAVLACTGAYLKFGVLKPLNLYQDKSVFELPFLMHSDEYLRFMVENAEELKQMEQNPTTVPAQPTAPTLPSQGTTASTTPTTESTDTTTTVPGTSSSADVTTQPSTVPTTEPSTAPPTESTGEPTGTPLTEPSTDTTPSTTVPPTTVPPTTAPPTTSGPNFDFPSGVTDDWFDNTLFIGDSRVVGLRDYARSGKADYFCDVGMTVFSYSKKSLSDKSFSSQTLESLLSQRQYDKIIICFGLNEAGYPLTSFKLAYEKFVNFVREKQPDATLILQSVMSVSRGKASTAWYLEPAYLNQMSAFIHSLCDGETVYFIDCNEYFADEYGYLYSSITNDGYHPTASGYRHWRDWIAFAVEQIGL